MIIAVLWLLDLVVEIWIIKANICEIELKIFVVASIKDFDLKIRKFSISY